MQLIDESDLLSVIQSPHLEMPFSDPRKAEVLEFSRMLRLNRGLNNNLRALGSFFNLPRLKKWEKSYSIDRKSRGICFQIAPSNTPVTSVYASLFSFLSGNLTLTRISDSSDEVDKCIAFFERHQYDFPLMMDSIKFISYPKDRVDITEFISKSSHVRLIWGGDNSINEIRKYEVSPDALDVTFPDKFSIAVCDASLLRSASQNKIKEIAHLFSSDISEFDQNACSSPKLICWISDGDCSDIKGMFYSMLEIALSQKKQSIRNYYDREYGNFLLATSSDLPIEVMKNISIIKLNEFSDLFSLRKVLRNNILAEIQVNSIKNINEVIKQKLQTIIVLELSQSQKAQLVGLSAGIGVDRIVIPGRSYAMSHIWDGINFFEILTRNQIIEINNLL